MNKFWGDYRIAVFFGLAVYGIQAKTVALDLYVHPTVTGAAYFFNNAIV